MKKQKVIDALTSSELYTEIISMDIGNEIDFNFEGIKQITLKRVK